MPAKGYKLSEKHKQRLREVNIGRKWTEEQKKQISESLKGHIPWNKGVKFSEDQKKNLNLSGLEKGRGWNKGKKGQKGYWTGKKRGAMSEEWKIKISEANKGKKKPPFSDEHKQKIRLAGLGKQGFWKGKKLTDEAKIKMSISKKGKKFSEEAKKNMRGRTGELSGSWKGGKSKCKQCGELTSSYTSKFCKKCYRGENSAFWEGGKTPLHKRIRKSAEYRLWRISVLERDGYICVWCGQKGGNLEVDHIKPFAFFPELRFAIDNGRTLCKPCHETTDTYRNKAHTFYKKFIEQNA
jgi:hypothetical protein